MGMHNALYDRPWLITEEGMRNVLDVATREHLDPELAKQIREEREARPMAVALRRASRLEGARNAGIRDGVAIVPIVGPIARYSDFFTEISGLASIEALATDMQIATTSPQVRAILLTIDSPGGQVDGVNEIAEIIYRARASMPVWAYVDGLAASAGYWLASAAEHIVIDDTALLGSIGAVLAVRDPTKTTVRDIEFVSSQSPNKRPDPTTEAGRSEFQRIVDQTAEVFIETVARNRGMDPAAVIAAGGRGGVQLGRYAVTAGLADELGDFESTLTALSQDTSRRGGMLPLRSLVDETRNQPANARKANATKAQEGTMPTIEELEAKLAESERAKAEAETRVAELQTKSDQALAAAKAAEQKTLEARASAWADEQIRAARAIPSQKDQLIATYTKMAGVEGGVESLEALYAGAPQHKLLGEQVAADGQLKTLPVARQSESDDDKDEKDRERARKSAERMNGRVTSRVNGTK